jgi:ERCC4-type nuclease
VNFIVAPTERDPHIHGLSQPDGTVSMLPERHGCDILWRARGEWWGVQRKEIKDFIASIQDGRLAREVAMMKRLPIKVVIIEGRLKFTTDGTLLIGKWTSDITRTQLEGMVMSLMEREVHVVWTDDTKDTARWTRTFAGWSQKPRHHALSRRPGPVSPWGHVSDEDWAVHLLQGFDGLGSEKARAIVRHYGGVPFSWSVTERELMEVPGIGKVLARRLIAALEHGAEGEASTQDSG